MSTIDKKFVMKYTVNDVSALELHKEYAVTEEHFGAPWKMYFSRDIDSLSLHLKCLKTTSEPWSIETILTFKVAAGDEFVTSEHRRNFENGQLYCGWCEFISLSSLQGHLQLRGKPATFEVGVKIKRMIGFGRETLRSFDAQKISDVALVVKDQKFHVLKQYLALQSSYFNSLLLGNFEESQKSEVTLADVDPDDLQNFLELLHGESSIDENTVTGILHLADMYDAPTAIRRCQEFLLEKSEKEDVEKLELALRYNLGGLKEKCLSEIKTVADIQKILAANLKEMDVPTLQAILQKSISFQISC